MDAFITKPIDDTQLHFHLTRAIERQLQRGIVLAPMPERAGSPAPSTAELDAMFGVQAPAPADLNERMRNAFAADLPRRRAELDAALEQGDREAVGRLLHGLRGSAGYLGENELVLLCGELEVDADAGRLEAVRLRLPALLALLTRFEETIA
jgi:HPt (histidine-containing phosphotransfer) domain-containing protein